MASGDDNEHAPLIRNVNPPSYVASVSEPNGVHHGVPELPPPYVSSQTFNIPCRVCFALIDISQRQNTAVVKCQQCNESTPIKNAPPGKKYVRCPCNCLLICSSNAQRISCPKKTCNRIINLAPALSNIPDTNMPGLCRVACGYCSHVFMVGTYSRVSNNHWFLAIYIVCFLIFLAALGRSLYYFTMRVSEVEGPA